MMNTKFVMPSTGYAMSDFQQNVMEVILNLTADFGSLENANDAFFRMFELAFPYATHDEILAFTKVQGAFRCINQLVVDNAEIFELIIQEQQSFKELT